METSGEWSYSKVMCLLDGSRLALHSQFHASLTGQLSLCYRIYTVLIGVQLSYQDLVFFISSYTYGFSLPLGPLCVHSFSL